MMFDVTASEKCESICAIVSTGIKLMRKVGFTKNTAMRHRRVGGRAVTVTAMLHRQRYRVIEKGKD
jgi:hypothetical protein